MPQALDFVIHFAMEQSLSLQLIKPKPKSRLEDSATIGGKGNQRIHLYLCLSFRKLPTYGVP